MTDKMREEFEAAYAAGVSQQKGADAFQPASLARSTDGYYVISLVQSAWWGWQQSRESLVMELPAAEAWDNDGRLDREKDDTADCAMGLVPVIDVRIALRASGITVAEGAAHE
ncbi:hypothetical protein [Pseudomonas sp. GXZC]|uniref:hypothetical protein n=1 Tax=Pseudomonas sp. GXZC TaxID=3003351 RepID=UPI0022AA64D3|nr:hypothetical protein [Pseudomonas sp. GXZC]WAT26774.1 hypothetical protein OZ428_22685 [Pseudomonas sp. GXZC]